MLVEGIMSENVQCVSPENNVKEIRDLFSRVSYHHLLVVQDSLLLGVISDRDVIGILSPFVDTADATEQDQSLLQKTAADIMSTKLVTTEKDTSIDTAAILLLENNISCLPVVSESDTIEGEEVEGKIVEGIITWKDMLKYYVYAT